MHPTADKEYHCANSPEGLIPERPDICEDELNRHRDAGDPMPIMWRVYKHALMWMLFTSNISLDSPACAQLNRATAAVLIGLASRCAQLGLSALALTKENRNRGALSIVARSICESAVKLKWIATSDSDARALRFIADGRRGSLELQEFIENNIARRAGDSLNVERTMLAAISAADAALGISHTELANQKKLPDLKSMMLSIGLAEPIYTAVQRIGSEAVHGTWSDLFFNYVDVEPAQTPRPKTTPGPRATQFSALAIILLKACQSYVDIIFAAGDERETFDGILEDSTIWVWDVYNRLCPAEYSKAST